MWIYRWWERRQDGQLHSRKKTVGDLEDLPSRARAWEAVAAMNLKINFDPSPDGRPRLFGELVDHYRKNELNEDNNDHKSFSTREGYESYLDLHIVPEWGSWRLDEIGRVAFAVKVEAWLKGKLTVKGKPMARGSKAKLRNIMSAVFTYALRHRWMDRNPMREVRQSAKRERVPARLTADELCQLLNELDLVHSVMILLLVPTGMRRGEILALQWKDVNWLEKTLAIHKSIWHQKLGPVKTEESEKLLPLDDEMLAIGPLRRQTPYAGGRRLGVRFAADARQAARVAGGGCALSFPARRKASWNRKARDLARFPSLALNPAGCERE